MTKRFKLRIPLDLHQAMLDQAVAESPNECCGLLAGAIVDGIGLVTHRFPLANIASAPRTEFLSEPRGMLAADKAMRAARLELLAIYHSHPTSEPIPSKKDIERSSFDSVMNLIISLASGQPKARAWWLANGEYCEGEFDIAERSARD